MDLSSSPANVLRRRAEEVFREQTSNSLDAGEAVSPVVMIRTPHELQTHQIEQEMQAGELRRARMELEAIRAQYADLYDRAPVGYVSLSPEGLIMQANHNAGMLLGVARDKLIMVPIVRFMAPGSQDAFHLDQQALRTHGATHACELEMVKDDGSTFWVHLTCNATDDDDRSPTCLAALTDITRLKHAQAALEESRDFARSLIRSLRDGCSVLDTDGTAIDVNPAFCGMTGFSKEELVGIGPPHPYWPPEEYSTIEAELANTLGENGGNFEFTFMRKNGERFPVIVSAFGVKDRYGETISYAATVKDITDRKQADEELRCSEEKYRSLHDSMMDAFASIDMHGRIIESNKAFQKMLGYTQEELSHLSYLDITPEKWHAMEMELVADEHFLARGYSELYEKEYRSKDGRVFPVELRNFLLHGHNGEPAAIWAIIRDITERKKAEQSMLEWNQTLERRIAQRTAELNLTEARFRQLAEATFEGISISEDGVLLDANPQLAVIHGCELSEMIGLPILDFIALESRELFKERIKDASETTYEFVGLRKDGTTFPGECHASMKSWQGRQLRVTAVRDLTSVKQAAARMLAQETELAHAQRLALISEVSAGIVHQIGQPLCAMGANLMVATAKLGTCNSMTCGGLEILRDVESDLGRMRDSIRHLNALAHPGQLTRMPVDLNAMVEEVLRILRREIDSHRIRAVVDIAGNLPQVLADGVQLSQVALNLVRNAIDACADCPPERRVLVIATREIAGEAVELSVRDTGAGISPEAMARMFTPFFSTKPDGLGIGLRLSRTIIEAHGGSIEGCNNSDGVGAVFRVKLPAVPGEDHAKV